MSLCICYEYNQIDLYKDVYLSVLTFLVYIFNMILEYILSECDLY